MAARYNVALARHDGEMVVAVLPAISDDAPVAVREGLARRRIASTTGQCPCGGRLTLPNRAARRRARKQGRVIRAEVEHENDCPALSAAVEAWLRPEGRGGGA